MKPKRYSWLLLFCLSQALTASAGDVQSVCVFGMACNLKDSTAYVTDIQPLEGIKLQKGTGFLLDRAAYGYQLKNYLTQENTAPLTSIIFYGKNKRAAEKEYQKVVRKLRSKGQKIVYLEAGSFRFTPALSQEP